MQSCGVLSSVIHEKRHSENTGGITDRSVCKIAKCSSYVKHSNIELWTNFNWKDLTCHKHILTSTHRRVRSCQEILMINTTYLTVKTMFIKCVRTAEWRLHMLMELKGRDITQLTNRSLWHEPLYLAIHVLWVVIVALWNGCMITCGAMR